MGKLRYSEENLTHCHRPSKSHMYWPGNESQPPGERPATNRLSNCRSTLRLGKSLPLFHHLSVVFGLKSLSLEVSQRILLLLQYLSQGTNKHCPLFALPCNKNVKLYDVYVLASNATVYLYIYNNNNNNNNNIFIQCNWVVTRWQWLFYM